MQYPEPPIIETEYKVVEEVRPPMKHGTFNRLYHTFNRLRGALDRVMVFCAIGMFGLLFMVISNTKAAWVDIGYFLVFGMVVGGWIIPWFDDLDP